LELRRKGLPAHRLHSSARPARKLATFYRDRVGQGKWQAPSLRLLCSGGRQTNATLLVAKLDRLSRNARFFFLISATSGREVSSPRYFLKQNTLTLGVMAGCLLSMSVSLFQLAPKPALAARRCSWATLRKPHEIWTPYAVRASAIASVRNTAKAKARADLVAPVIQAARLEGCVSLSSNLPSILMQIGVTTPARVEKWTPTAVANAERANCNGYHTGARASCMQGNSRTPRTDARAKWFAQVWSVPKPWHP